MADKELPNVKVLTNFRIKGKSHHKGSVVSKKDFPAKSDWQNLCHMTPPRAEETDEAVKSVDPKKAKAASKKDLPGA